MRRITPAGERLPRPQQGDDDYALDATTKNFYAAAGLAPSPKSLQAQAGTQDAGGYILFTRAQAAKKWTVYKDGLGVAPAARRPITISTAMLAVWD
ncbi:MAG: hypothetical protein ACRDVC_06945 [Acidimicrobiales bacterium]